jgi:hypothetical protein
VLACFIAFFSGLSSRASAQESSTITGHSVVAEGSTLTHRSQTDLCYGQVYIYAGGVFPVGTIPFAFEYLFDSTDGGNTTGYITPLLLEWTSAGVLTVVGIGNGFGVTLNSAAQGIPLSIVGGIKFAANKYFTFGYVNAIVDSSGVPVSTSQGTVDFDPAADSGTGDGGAGTTNVWAATGANCPSISVPLGTTFGFSGFSADYPLFGAPYRTYSARALGVVKITN